MVVLLESMQQLVFHHTTQTVFVATLQAFGNERVGISSILDLWMNAVITPRET